MRLCGLQVSPLNRRFFSAERIYLQPQRVVSHFIGSCPDFHWNTGTFYCDNTPVRHVSFPVLHWRGHRALTFSSLLAKGGSRSCSSAFSNARLSLSASRPSEGCIIQSLSRRGNLLCGLPHIPQATSMGVEPTIFGVTSRRDNHYATKSYWDFKGDPSA